MNTPIRIQVTPNDLFLLKNSAGTALSPLSPAGVPVDSSRSSVGQAMSPSLLGADGQFRPELLPTIQTLAYTTSYGMVTFIAEGLAFETAVYYPAANSASPLVGLSLMDEELLIESPPPLEGLLENTTQYVGDSLIRVSDLQLELNLLDGWVFFGALDAARRALLNQLLTNGSDQSITIAFEDVQRTLQPQEDEFQWLAPYYANCVDLQFASEADVHQGLQRLAQQGLWQTQGQTITLQPSFAQFAREFLIIDSFMRMQAAGLDTQGTPVSNTVRTIHGRSNAVLMWSHDEEGVSLWCVSPAQTMLILSTIMEAPSEIFSDQPVPGMV